MSDDPDRELLVRFGNGDQPAFEALFRTFEGEVYRWVVRIVRDPSAAEEVTVESFWRLWRGRARFDTDRSFGAWLRRIATHAALDHLRAARRHLSAEPVDERTAAPPGPDCDTREALTLAFRRLRPKLQVVATLALVEQRSHAEIADALGLPLGTVKSRLSRALAVLERELTRMGAHP